MNEQFHIRRAVIEDTADLASIHVSSSRAAYSHIHEVTIGVSQRLKDWSRWLAQSDHLASVIEVNGSVVGFVSLKPLSADTIDMEMLYLSPSHFRRGLGRAICEYAFTQARKQGFRRMTVRTLEGNTSGRRFYEALGFNTLQQESGNQSAEFKYEKRF